MSTPGLVGNSLLREEQFGEHTVRVRLLGQNEQALFMSRHYQFLRRDLEDRKPFLSTEQFAEQEKELDTARKSGELGIMTERGKEFIQTRAGVECLMGVIFDCPYPVMLEILAQHSEQLTRVFREVLEESFPFARRNRQT